LISGLSFWASMEAVREALHFNGECGSP